MAERDVGADYVRQRVLERKLERLAKAELRGESPRWVEQAFSPLGPRKHIWAVRRRIAEAEGRGIDSIELGALRIKRRYLLTPESVAEELGKLQGPHAGVANDTREADACAGFLELVRQRKANRK